MAERKENSLLSFFLCLLKRHWFPLKRTKIASYNELAAWNLSLNSQCEAQQKSSWFVIEHNAQWCHSESTLTKVMSFTTFKHTNISAFITISLQYSHIIRGLRPVLPSSPYSGIVEIFPSTLKEEDSNSSSLCISSWYPALLVSPQAVFLVPSWDEWKEEEQIHVGCSACRWWCVSLTSLFPHKTPKSDQTNEFVC